MDSFSSINAGLLKDLLIISAAAVGFMSMVGAGVLTIVKFFRKAEPAVPQPVRVTKEPEFITTEAHERDRTEMKRRVAELESRMLRVENKMESDKQEIIKAMDEKIERLEDKLDVVPSRVIALLKDTKDLIPSKGGA
jgi:hypothetical protein